MKKKLITLLLLSFYLTVFSQENFEGVIEFSVNFKDKKGVFTDEEAKTQIGTRQTYYAKGAKFHYVSNGSFGRRGFYNGNDTVFTHFNGMKKVWFNLISEIDSNRMKGYKITDQKKTILGYECTQAIITTSESSEILYFMISMLPRNSVILCSNLSFILFIFQFLSFYAPFIYNSPIVFKLLNFFQTH